MLDFHALLVSTLQKQQKLFVFNFRLNRTHITKLQYKYEELSVHYGVIAMSKLKSQIRNLKLDFLSKVSRRNAVFDLYCRI